MIVFKLIFVKNRFRLFKNKYSLVTCEIWRNVINVAVVTTQSETTVAARIHAKAQPERVETPTPASGCQAALKETWAAIPDSVLRPGAGFTFGSSNSLSCGCTEEL